MRILLDECVNAGVRQAFPGHVVQTVSEIGWRSSKDAPLLSHASAHFDVFVTIDRRIVETHITSSQQLGLLIVRVPNNELDTFRPLFAEMLAAAEGLRRGAVAFVRHPKAVG